MLRASRKAKIACRNRKLPTSEHAVSCKTEYFKSPRNCSLAADFAIFTGDSIAAGIAAHQRGDVLENVVDLARGY